eukprot:m.16417 g.16417  ORF g.16417 m.16417 type:complete len:72 (-) comp5046_c0_seq2:1961-2176(-)
MTTCRTQCSLLIQGGLVVDGTGTRPFKADVATTGRTITAIGPNLIEDFDPGLSTRANHDHHPQSFRPAQHV